MCSRISIGIWRSSWRRRESPTSPPWGGQRWGQRSSGGSAPLASRRTRRTTTSVLSAARSGASRHLAVGVDVRSGEPTPRDLRRRRLVPPESRGQNPRGGQERPPRRRPLRGPGSDPGGVAPALFATTATVSRRQTSRPTARGGLSTAMRPVVALVVVACRHCLLDRSATEEMPQIARVAVLFEPETRVRTSRRSGCRTGIHASDRTAAAWEGIVRHIPYRLREHRGLGAAHNASVSREQGDAVRVRRVHR
jgi:hypothetical protein